MAMKNLKKEHPKNKLIKYLSSSLHGVLSSYKKVIVDDDEDLPNDPDNFHFYKYKIKADGNGINYFYNKNQVSHHPFRIKPFLVSYGRTKLAKVALQDIDKVVRIATDSISYTGDYLPTEGRITKNDFNLVPNRTGRFHIPNNINIEKV